MNICTTKFHPNQKMVTFKGKIFWRENLTGGGNFEKKMKTYKMPMQNKPIYENSSKSDNGKVVKYTGKIFWGAISQGGRNLGGEFKKKNENLQNAIAK